MPPPPSTPEDDSRCNKRTTYPRVLRVARNPFQVPLNPIHNNIKLSQQFARAPTVSLSSLQHPPLLGLCCRPSTSHSLSPLASLPLYRKELKNKHRDYNQDHRTEAVTRSKTPKSIHYGLLLPRTPRFSLVIHCRLNNNFKESPFLALSVLCSH